MRISNRWNIFFALAFSLAGMFLAGEVEAVCPVCTVAVGACLGISRYLGIDDVITSLWIGGLLVSMIAWTISWLDKKNIKFIFRKILVVAVLYGLTLWPLWAKGIVGHPANKLWGMDKVFLGIIIGSAVFILAIAANNFLKKKNAGKVYFPFQKVVVPLVFLSVSSLIFYFLTC